MTEYLDRYPTMHEYAEGKRINPKLTDLISRADAIDAFENKVSIEGEDNAYKFGLYVQGVMDKIKALPSADAEQTDKLENQPCLVERNYTTEGGGGEIYHQKRQQGKWLPIEETIPTYDGGEKTWLTGMKCSKCGKMFDLRVGYKFCPNCGAIMKGGDDE